MFVDSHSYGSTVYAASNSNTWYYGSSGGPFTKGTLYTNMVTKANNALTKLALTRLKGIFVIVSINDISNATAITDTTSCLTQLIADLRTDFGPIAPIYINMVGLASGYPSARFQSVRSTIKDLEINNANVYITANESLLYSWRLYDSVTTPLHFTQAGNNKLGDILYNYISSTEIDKDVRRILANMNTQISSSTRKQGIRDFVSNMKSAGYWTLMDSIQIFRGEDVLNLMNDFVGFTAGTNGSFGSSGDSDVTFTANDRISGNGTNQHWQTRFAQSIAKYASASGASSDFFCMIKTVTMTTAAGTLASIMGGSGRVALFQDASSRTSYNLNNATPITYTTDTKLQSNTWYTIRTDGANAMLYKGSSQVKTSAQVPLSSAAIGLMDIFARNNSNPDSPTERYNGEVYCFLFGKYTGIDIGTLYLSFVLS